MPDFPDQITDLPDSNVAETLFTMHGGIGHVPGTNRILANIKALSQKLGIGPTTPAPVANSILKGGAAGASTWGKVTAAEMTGPGAGSANTVFQTVNGTDVVLGGIVPAAIAAGGTANRVVATANGTTVAMQQVVTGMIAAGAVGIRQLDYHAGDLHNGTSFSANVWTELFLTPFYITFPVSQSNSLVLISAFGLVWAYGSTNNVSMSTRLILDHDAVTQAVQTLYVGGWPGGNVYANTLSGSGMHALTNLVAGTHKLKVQVLSSSFASQIFLQGASSPATQYLTIQIVEIQR